MPALSEVYLRKRSLEILKEKTEEVSFFDEDKEAAIPVFDPNGKDLCVDGTTGVKEAMEQ